MQSQLNPKPLTLDITELGIPASVSSSLLGVLKPYRLNSTIQCGGSFQLLSSALHNVTPVAYFLQGP
jgi:hypothetical protein